MIWLHRRPATRRSCGRSIPALRALKAAVKSGRWGRTAPCGSSPTRTCLRRGLRTAGPVAQRWTRQHFAIQATPCGCPMLRLPAAFQILRLGRVEFFCTTKMAWNDTTRHPYETFRWKGIDGSTVLTNLNVHNSWPDPQRLIEQWNWIQHKDVDDRALLAYGHGDGGGGPMAEMLEVAGKLADLEGCPRARHTTLSDLMKGIRDSSGSPSGRANCTWSCTEAL